MGGSLRKIRPEYSKLVGKGSKYLKQLIQLFCNENRHFCAVDFVVNFVVTLLFSSKKFNLSCIHVSYDLFYFSVSLACGATTSENCTYLTLAATAAVAGTGCTYTICPASSTVSRIRLDLTVNFIFCLNSSISPTATQLGTPINILVNNPAIIQSRLLPTR